MHKLRVSIRSQLIQLGECKQGYRMGKVSTNERKNSRQNNDEALRAVIIAWLKASDEKKKIALELLKAGQKH